MQGVPRWLASHLTRFSLQRWHALEARERTPGLVFARCVGCCDGEGSVGAMLLLNDTGWQLGCKLQALARDTVRVLGPGPQFGIIGVLFTLLPLFS